MDRYEHIDKEDLGIFPVAVVTRATSQGVRVTRRYCGRVIELHLRGRVAPGRRDDLVAFLREAIPYYEQPGGIRVRLMWDVAEPDRFIEVVEYADQRSYDLDQARVADDAEMKNYLRRWNELLAEPPQVETYRLANP